MSEKHRMAYIYPGSNIMASAIMGIVASLPGLGRQAICWDSD